MFKVYVEKNSNPVHFRGVGDSAETISLTRDGGHCFYFVGDMHKHDNHAPYFSTDAAREKYLDRVKVALAAAGDVGKISEDGYVKNTSYELLITVEDGTQPTTVGDSVVVKTAKPETVTLDCQQCGHVWESKTGNPQRCPNLICRSSKWK